MSQNVFSQETKYIDKRVYFPRGITTVIIKNIIKSKLVFRYKFWAKSGQTSTTHITSSETQAKFDVYIYKGGLESIAGVDARTDWQAILSEDGDYVAGVYPHPKKGKESVNFTLEVSIK